MSPFDELARHGLLMGTERDPAPPRPGPLIGAALMLYEHRRYLAASEVFSLAETLASVARMVRPLILGGRLAEWVAAEEDAYLLVHRALSARGAPVGEARPTWAFPMRAEENRV